MDKKPSVPLKNNPHRTALIRGYDIFGTPPQTEFDDLTALAAGSCNTPIAWMCLLDEDRHFIKSQYGSETGQLSLEQAFCTYALASERDFFEIPDLLQDTRFKAHPLVTGGPHLRAYAAVPLRSEDGIGFGTLCVMDKKPFSLSPHQIKALKALSRQLLYVLELRKKTNQLQTCQDKLRENALEMEDFTRTAAHDLRAPIRGIDSLIQFVERKNKALWDEKDRKCFELIHGNTLQLTQLISALVDFGNSGKVEGKPEEIDLNDLVETQFELLSREHPDPKPILKVGDTPPIVGYRTPLTLLFRNLIDNALRYRSSDRVPQINITVSGSDTAWIIEVRDNGIGIETEQLETIFKPFKRLHAQSEIAGSGLGLATCKKIVQNLNGTISVDSRLKSGTSFTICIPRQNLPPDTSLKQGF